MIVEEKEQYKKELKKKLKDSGVILEDKAFNIISNTMFILQRAIDTHYSGYVGILQFLQDKHPKIAEEYLIERGLIKPEKKSESTN